MEADLKPVSLPHLLMRIKRQEKAAAKTHTTKLRGQSGITPRKRKR